MKATVAIAPVPATARVLAAAVAYQIAVQVAAILVRAHAAIHVTMAAKAPATDVKPTLNKMRRIFSPISSHLEFVL